MYKADCLQHIHFRLSYTYIRWLAVWWCIFISWSSIRKLYAHISDCSSSL